MAKSRPKDASAGCFVACDYEFALRLVPLVLIGLVFVGLKLVGFVFIAFVLVVLTLVPLVFLILAGFTRLAFRFRFVALILIRLVLIGFVFVRLIIDARPRRSRRKRQTQPQNRGEQFSSRRHAFLLRKS